MQIDSASLLFTGLFRYNSKTVDDVRLLARYVNWRERLYSGNYKDTFEFFRRNYYDSFVTNMFPEINYQNEVINQLAPNRLNHFSLKECLTPNNRFKNLQLILLNKNQLPFSIEYIDLFHFTNGIGMFTINIHLPSDQLTADNISLFTYHFRNLDCSLVFEGETMHLKTFCEKEILQGYNLEDTNWDIYNPTLKTFQNINLKEAIPEKELENLLYDLGTSSKPGTAAGNNESSPSQKYLSQLMENNAIHTFVNWKALSLNDSFTRISMNFGDKFKSWENEFFMIYVYCLYLKSNLFIANSKLSDVLHYNKSTMKIRNEFIDFMNNYSQSHISYKFMPNILLNKISNALDIPSEIEKMEMKIERIGDMVREKNSNKMNLILATLSVLSLLSIFHDASDWIVQMGFATKDQYIEVGLVLFFVLVPAVLYIIFKKK